MKKLLLMLMCAALMLAIVAGCGEKKADEADDMTAGGMADEMADSTRMDSAMVDSMGHEMADSAGAMMEEGEEAMEEGGH